MALQKLASIAVRPRCTLWIAALSDRGIDDRRLCEQTVQSYRPIYSSPAPLAAPCTNCGGSSCDGHDRRTGEQWHGQLRSLTGRSAVIQFTVVIVDTVAVPFRQRIVSRLEPWKRHPSRDSTTSRP